MPATLSTPEQDAATPSSDEQLVGLERTRPRRGTGDTFDSTSTSVEPEKCDTVHALELHPSADDSSASYIAAVVGTRLCARKPPGRWQRFGLRWLTAYRVLIFTVITINIAALIAQLVVNPAVEAPLTATAANVMAAVLLRQEELINLSFTLVSKLPPTLPLSIRKTIADFHHYGGVHVGCAVSALLWYITFTALNTIRVLALLSLNQTPTFLYIDITTSYTALLTILTICITSIPRFRSRFHNTFEAIHRFGGWATLLTLWIHTGTSPLTSHTPLHTKPPLYLLTLTTLLFIHPWLRIRHIPISTTPLSPTLLQITLPHSTPHNTTLRLSTSPWTQWHAFATISSSSSSTIIVSKAGDWTASLLASPTEQIWIRNPPVLNFLSFAPLFNSILLVATGAGIAPVLSLLSSPAITYTRVRVLWCVSDPHAAHWGFALSAIRAADHKAVVFDSRAERLDLGFEAGWVAVREEVEAVFVVGNRRVTGSVVRSCGEVGVKAYGAVFDS